MLLVGTALFGLVLGRFFKVFVLIPACCFAFVLAFAGSTSRRPVADVFPRGNRPDNGQSSNRLFYRNGRPETFSPFTRAPTRSGHFPHSPLRSPIAASEIG